jgi:hypothetical protein
MTARSSNARAGFLIVVLAALFTYGLIRIFAVRFATGEVYPEYSSLRSSPAGAKLLYDSLSRIPGLSVTRNYFPLEYIEGDGATIFLLAVNAGQLAGDPDIYVDKFERLAARGHRVVAALTWEGAKAPEHTGELDKHWHLKLRFDTDEKHPHQLYFDEAPEWRVLDRDGPRILAVERSFKKGSVVLFSESRDFANDAVVKLAGLGLVTAALGPNMRVIFDEQHFGIAESGSVVGLARRFRLTGLAAGLALCAALFIWKNASGFPPPVPAIRPDTLSGRTSISGLFTLLRRHVAPRDLADTCWNEWLAGNRQTVTPARILRAQAILRDYAGRPLDAAREIQTVLQSKGPL